MIRSDVPPDAEVKRPPGGRSSVYWRKTLDKRWGVLLIGIRWVEFREQYARVRYGVHSRKEQGAAPAEF